VIEMPPLGSAVSEVHFAHPGRALFQRIGEFLFAQHMEPNPANFALAHAVLTDPESEVARQIAAWVDDGVRLTQRDIDELGLAVARIGEKAEAPAEAMPDRGEILAARAQAQMDGFADVVTAMHAHARDFGRDLAASADALERSRVAQDMSMVAIDDVARITGAMVARVRDAEQKLEQAHQEAEQLRRELAEARGDALSDPLTGLPNRRAFEEAYAERVAAGAKPCIAVCDVDHFKHVNDRFGHIVGDRVLRAIGTALAATCEGQFVARYGGEEFAILFDLDLPNAVATIDRARHLIARKRFRVRESDAVIGTVTFSTGISVSAPGEDMHQVFGRADALLYAAKGAGRDCIFSDSDLRD
jgi:diguanylate cyclase